MWNREEETSSDLSANPCRNFPFDRPSRGPPKIPAQDLRWNFRGPPAGTIEKLKTDMLHNATATVNWRITNQARNSEQAGYDCANRIVPVNSRVTVGALETFGVATVTNLRTVSCRRATDMEYFFCIRCVLHYRLRPAYGFDLVWGWSYS
jgi:hypothetical protein